MGILDFFKGSQEKKEKQKRVQSALKSVNEAVTARNVRDGVARAFYAVEALGNNMLEIERTDSTTAREYVGLLEKEGIIREGELEELVLNFELSKYSEFELTDSHLKRSVELMETFHQRCKSPRKKPKTDGKKKRTRKRRAPSGSARRRRR